MIYTVRIVYKNGYTHDFECTEFTVTRGMGGVQQMTWAEAWPSTKPLMIGVDEIAAVWQLGMREE